MRNSTVNCACKKPRFDLSYLIETDHRFTDYKSYTSSDYLLSRLSMDPSMAQKRLGDGFYEQKLISDQITQLTGRRFTGQYTSTEDQTRALMDSSVSAAQQLKLSTGIALSKEQAAALTQDIVWMVEEQITLADGTSTTALVPRVYLSAQHAIDLSPDGAVIAAEVIDIRSEGSLSNTGVIKSTRASMIAAQDILNKGSIQSSGDLLLTASRDISNISGSISGRRVSLSAGNNLLNSTASLSIGTRASGSEQNSSTGANGLGSFIPVDTGQASAYNTLIGNIGSISASDDLSLEAGNTLSILGASLSSGGNAQLKAGNQLIVNTLTTQSGITSGGPYKNDSAQTQNIRSSISAGNNLSLSSGGDMQLTAANLSAGRSASLMSGGNLTLDTAKDITSHNQSAGRNINQAYDETVLGTNLKAGGNITLAATNATLPSPAGRGAGGEGSGNINLMSANLTSDTGKLTIIADNNINIGTTAEKHTSLIQTYSESSGFMSSSSSTNRTETWRTNQIGSSLAANSISFSSGQDINITGSDITATNDATLIAGRDLNIFAATNTYGSESYSHTTSSGLQINGFNISDKGPEITTQQRTDATQQSFSRSNLTAKNGNLNLVAGNNLIVGGSDLAANAGNLNLNAGNTLAILSGIDTLSETASIYTVNQTSLISKQKRSIETTNDTSNSFGSTLNANRINLQSGMDTVLQGAKLNAGTAGINIDAGNDIKLLAAYNSASTSRHETLVTDGPNVSNIGSIDLRSDRAKNKTNTFQSQTADVTQLASLGNITTHSNGNTFLQGTDLIAQGSIDLSAGDAFHPDSKIFFQGAKSAEARAEQSESSSDLWQNSNGQGSTIETMKLANIKAGGGLAVNATGGIEIELPKAKQSVPAGLAGKAAAILSPEQQAAKDKADINRQLDTLASQPGQEWLTQLAKQDTTKFNQVKLAAEHWEYSHEGLTPAGAAVVVLVVTYVSGGTASSAAASIAGSSAVATAAITAGLTTLASQAAVSLINNQGDMGKTLNDLGKSENIKALATAMVTAGVLQGISNKLSVDGTKLSDISTQNSTFTQQLGKTIINNTTSAIVNTAVNGGNLEDNLREGLKNALIDTAAANVARDIGDLQADDKINTFTQKFAHAVAGCAAGAAKANDCSSGALGAVVGEMAAEMYTPSDSTSLTPKQLREMQGDIVSFSKMMAGVAAATTGEDVNLAASTGGNAAANNYLSHWQQAAYDKEMKACSGMDCVATQLRWASISVKQNYDLARGMVIGAGIEVKDAVTAVANMPETLKILAANPELLKDMPANFLQDLETSYNKFQTSYEKAGADGAKDAGVQITHMLTQLGTLATTAISGGAAAGYTAAKVANLFEKVGVVAKTTEKVAVADTAAKVAGNVSVVDSKATLKGNANGDFQPQGSQRDPMTFPDGVKMVRQLEATGLSNQEAIYAASEYIKTGTSLPLATPIDITDKLVKVVPTGGAPSPTTGYWLRANELPSLIQDSANLSNKLGLPPGMQVNSYDVFQMTPHNGSVVFESKIAPTTVDGIPNTTGGAPQSIVVDRNQFTLPVKIDTIIIKNGN